MMENNLKERLFSWYVRSCERKNLDFMILWDFFGVDGDEFSWRAWTPIFVKHD
jgi:hypothetical protein